MKKTVFLCAILLNLGLLFSACQSEVEQRNTSLSIYAEGELQEDITQYTGAVDRFRETHSGVAVSFYALPADKTIDGEKAQAALRTALAGGGGPDVIVGTCWDQDVEKLAGSGIFYDMKLLLEKDTAFALDGQYQKNVIERGVFGGKQIVMPLLFRINTFGSTEELLAKSNFQGLESYGSEAFVKNANDFLDAHPEMALFNNSDVEYRAILQAVFPNLSVETLQSDEFERVISLCRRNMERQTELGIDARDLARPYFAIESGKYLFQCESDNQVLSSLGTYSSLGNATYFTLANNEGTLSADIVVFAAINAQSPNLQNAWDLVKILLTYYQDPMQYMPERNITTSMYGEMGQKVLLSANQGIVDRLQSNRIPFLNFVNADRSITQVPLRAISQTVADEYAGLASKVGEVCYNYTSAQVLSYFDAYVAGEREYAACLEDAIGYVTLHQSE